jgi:two-component system nitrogen regulation response regulator GlnG
MTDPHLLVIDDDPLVHVVFEDYCESNRYRLTTAGSAREALGQIEKNKPDIIVLDLMLPDLSGLEVLRELRTRDAKVPIIVVSAQQQSDLAIEALKGGAFDYLSKPFDLRKVDESIRQALETRRKMVVAVQVGDDASTGAVPGDKLVGMSPIMQEVYKAIARIAPHDVSVLIQGETGTGKELVARAIYQHSRRAGQPFLAINCAAIPETLLESELFGHERGAFTGADRQRIGKFEQTAGGTTLLDEIGDMPLNLQAKLLRVLEQRQFQRLGGTETLIADVRILAATHRRLDEAVAAGQFRADLFYRLNVCTIELPALRERLEDLPLLVQQGMKRAGEETGLPIKSLATDIWSVLQAHSWPGNVRELFNALKYAILHSRGPQILVEDLPATLRKHSQNLSREATSDWPDAAFVAERLAADTRSLQRDVFERVEQALLKQVMAYTGGNLSRAANILGVTRGHLRKKLRQHGLHPDGDAANSSDDEEAGICC